MPMVVLGVTGCIAAYKACEVLRELQRFEVDVHVVMTSAATRFVGPMTFEALSRHPVFHDQWALGANSDIRHISLAEAADLLLVAPATANIVGKFARGIADDPLSTLYTATVAPTVIAPAMNTNMFDHPAVQENLATLRSRGVRIVEPGSGYLACGWLGRGRLAEVGEIVEATMAALARRRDLSGETVLVTAGPTVEDIDPVRFVSNRSSGRMGYRVAEAARDRGAQVILVSGPTELPAPSGLEYVSVRSAEEMARAVQEHFDHATVVVAAAAVADYRPVAVSAAKLKKGDGPRTLELVRTEDILGSLGDKKGERLLVGFAAETENLVDRARAKMSAKKLDLIVANDVADGFGGESNAAVLVRRAGAPVEVPLVSKRELADRICDEIVELRARVAEPEKAKAGPR
ncbi:MAG: bifunctional phosphopantothenoylcysteine decarboxylase/phosphopantothenate--cysteine ligase CoaBC [Acidobacteria bacterium]|jgi:phosphopantothenoylcysteine decarboxylase/phosphopantothenate--cysteine ligase|nr:bifunctional phosphopantothenoylcysteine decarboxylase/phosphopantothenate--cysteine ligase CoaBC [Acidobacteriota bacterium]